MGDLTQAECENVVLSAKPLSFQSVVERKHHFPGCYYRKADGKTFWNSFVAEYGYGKGGTSRGNHKVYAPICKVRRCKNNKAEYGKAAHKKVAHSKKHKKVAHPKTYKKVAHPKTYKKVAHPKTHKKVEPPKTYKKVEHPKKHKKVMVEEPHYHN